MRWFIAGVIATVGALGFAARAVVVAGLHLDTLLATALIAVLSGFAGGAALRRHAVLRGWEAPAAAACAVLIGGGFISVMWRRTLLVDVSPLAIALAVVVAAGGAFAGSRAVEKIASTTPTWFSLLMLSGVLTQGLIMSVSFPLLALNANVGLSVLLMFGCAVAGGFWTQMISPVRRIWACGSGAMLMVLLILDLDPPLPMLLILIGSFGVYALFGALGAFIASKARPKPVALVEVPAAHTEVDKLGL